jgi:hypothetical protein
MARMKDIADELVDLLNEATTGLPVHKGPLTPIETSGAIFVIPQEDAEEPEAIGDNFIETWALNIEVEIPYEDSEENIDTLFDYVDDVKAVVRDNREITSLNARQGRYGPVTYALVSWGQTLYRMARISVTWVGEQ